MKPKILFIMHMPPPVHGASTVGQFIHDSELVNSLFDCHYVNLAVATRLEDVGKGGWHKAKDIWKKLIEVRKAVKAVKPDLVYITPNSAGIPFYKDFITVMMLKMMGQKVVMHFHNKGVETRQDKWLDNWMYKRYFKDVKLILLADALYEDVKKYVKREDVFVCPNAIPAISNANQVNENSDHVPHILWLTNIMKTKGIMEYLSALKILKDKGVKFQADFVGGLTQEMSGDEFDSAISMLGLNGCCTYYGPKYGDDKYSFFSQADVFVLPSYTEAFPVSILEAMQFALPVVASNVGGVSAEVEEGVSGFLLGGQQPIMLNTFRPDVCEIADKLQVLLTDTDLRHKMGEAGREKYEREFTLEVFEKRIVEILNHCLHY
mgnify:FL=1|jgi:glycosyltransferase involved in cell wall biosynthesis